MKTLRLLFLLAAGMGLSGCPEPPCFGGGGGNTGVPLQTSVVLMGEQVRLPIAPQFVSGCGTGFDALPAPSTLSVEISGPDNLLVEHQAKMGSPSTAVATIEFTPDKQGRYHVFAAFDPVGGIHQIDLYAARDRSAEAPLQSLPNHCGALERTRRGGWLCDGAFMRDGTVLRRFTGRVAVAEDVVWVATETSVQRFVDLGGTALEPAGSLAHSQGSVEFLLGTPDELVLLHSTTLQRVTFDGTELSSTGTSSWQPDLSPLTPPGPRGLLLRAGDHLAVVTSTSTSSSTGLTNRVCPYQLEGGRFVRTATSCRTFANRVVGFEPAVLWMGTETFSGNVFSDLRRLEWGSTGLVEVASLPLGSNLELSTHAIGLRTSIVPVVNVPISSTSPRPRGTVAVYSPERRTLLLELLDSEIPQPLASSHLLWGPTSTSPTQRIRVRPSTP
ncbi:MAG: hypothetical protein JXB05_14150 [Myxococcaceae bacterium]|nr:hypothetical protein [Myxococcaceae bacterium]